VFFECFYYYALVIIIGKYFSLFSMITQTSITKSTRAIGKPDDAVASNIPTITGKIITAPNALYRGIIIRMPPIISAMPDLRFEVDGANAARDFLKSHGLPKESLQLVWDTIALHTTIGVAEHKENEVALMYSGVGLDVMGEGYENLSAEHREEIIHAFPRNDFKKNIIPTFFGGFEHKTETTFGNIKADVCAFMIPNFHRKNFCDCILHSPWSE
jgi:hypothetical protein